MFPKSYVHYGGDTMQGQQGLKAVWSHCINTQETERKNRKGGSYKNWRPASSDKFCRKVLPPRISVNTPHSAIM